VKRDREVTSEGYSPPPFSAFSLQLAQSAYMALTRFSLTSAPMQGELISLMIFSLFPSLSPPSFSNLSFLDAPIGLPPPDIPDCLRLYD